jgi:hypothetical protein
MAMMALGISPPEVAALKARDWTEKHAEQFAQRQQTRAAQDMLAFHR